jgi:hypothetical protein
MTIYRSNDEVFALMDAYEAANPSDTSAARAFASTRAIFAERGTMSLITIKAFLGLQYVYMAPGPIYLTAEELAGAADALYTASIDQERLAGTADAP